ncbi:hypothetical protein SEEH1514_19711 [Salmonella enterica subsp. enterica serovar Heidelberg str. N1514]|nr:hypothetical protein SEEH1514_19711 [Salmonella enterica subsp. enterica serovar Heidelberg str. N1514]
MTNPTLAPQSDEYQQIHNGIVQLLDTARTQTVRSINTIMTATYWEMGRRIVEFEQGGEARAAYGEQARYRPRLHSNPMANTALILDALV